MTSPESSMMAMEKVEPEVRMAFDIIPLPPKSVSKEWYNGVEKVEPNDDILMAILIRLPPKSLFKSRFVSKRWYDIITRTCFLNSYEARIRKQQLRLLAFIQMTPYLHQSENLRPPPLMNILLLPNPVIDKYVIRHFGFEYGFFIASSNALILSGYHSKNSYYVMNLVTRGCISLPRPPEIYILPSMTLVYDEKAPELVPNYKVLSAQTEFHGNIISIQIYCSKTRKWTKSKLKGVEHLRLLCSKPPIAVNGVLHWYSYLPWGLLVLDTKDIIVDGGENNVQLIMLPDGDGIKFGGNFTFARSSNDQLLFGAINRTSMRFWKLPKYKHESYMPTTTIRSTEWILVETISLDSLRKDITPLLLNIIPVYKEEKLKQRVLDSIASGYFRFEALIPWNSNIFAVIRFNFMGRESNLYKMIFLHNLQDKSFELVNHDGMRSSKADLSKGSCYGWYPYMEPLTLSSYGSLS